MAASLAAQFPDTKTYRGRGVDDPTVTTRFDLSPPDFTPSFLIAKERASLSLARRDAGRIPSVTIRVTRRSRLEHLVGLLLGAEQLRLSH